MATLDSILNALAARPDLAAASNADAATALNQPILTPRQGVITIVTVAAVLGATRAGQILAALQQAAASVPEAAVALATLTGPGVTAAEAVATATVLAQASLWTTAEATQVLATVSYACGTPDVTADQVATARAVIARSEALQALAGRVQQIANTFAVQAISPAVADPAKPMPTLDDFKTFVGEQS